MLIRPCDILPIVRSQESVTELMESIVANGDFTCVSGVPVLVPTHKKGHFTLLTFGHRAEAIYMAHAKFKMNINVQLTVAGGLKGCVLLHKDCVSAICIQPMSRLCFFLFLIAS